MFNIAGVTGINGFIGKHFLPRLLEEHDFVVSYLRGGHCQIFNKNGLVKNVHKNYEIDKNYVPSVFYNLATYYNPHPQNIDDIMSITESNIIFPLKILKKIDKPMLRYINFCSYLQLLHKRAQSPYSLSKEYLKESLVSIFGEISNIFLFDTFGSNDERNKVVDIFIKKIIAKEEICIPINDIRINLSEISDVCYSITPLQKIPIGNSCIHSPFTINLLDLANLLMELIGNQTEIKHEKNKQCLYSLCGDLPTNIFKKSDKLSLADKLMRRINEIRKA